MYTSLLLLSRGGGGVHIVMWSHVYILIISITLKASSLFKTTQSTTTTTWTRKTEHCVGAVHTLECHQSQYNHFPTIFQQFSCWRCCQHQILVYTLQIAISQTLLTTLHEAVPEMSWKRGRLSLTVRPPEDILHCCWWGNLITSKPLTQTVSGWQHG